MASALTDRSPLPELVDDSFQEAVFLWTRWESELTSLTRNLDEVWSWTEDRLHGALAGVHVAPGKLRELAQDAMNSDEPARVVVGAAVLASTSDGGALQVLMNALATATCPKLASIIRALEVAGSNQALSDAAAVLANGSAAHQAALCRLKTFRSVKPGLEMRVAFDSNQPDLQITALSAARYVDERDLDDWISVGSKHANPDVRRAAIVSGIARGSPIAWKAALDTVLQPLPQTAPLLRWIALLGGPEERALIYSALRVPYLQREALWALGHIGSRQAVEYCLKGMAHEKLARFAAEAYCHITGADLNRDQLAATEAPAEAPAFENDDLDANLVPAQEDLWPLPDVEAVQRHWRTIQSRYSPDVRYVRGQPVSLDALLNEIESGPMLRRPDLVMNLAARSKGAYDVATRAFVSRQRHMMSRSRSALLASGA